MATVFYCILFFFLVIALMFCMPRAKISTRQRNQKILDEAKTEALGFEILSVDWHYDYPKFTVSYKPEDFDQKITVVVQPSKYLREHWTVLDSLGAIQVPGEIALHLTVLHIGYRQEQDKAKVQAFYKANQTKENK